MQVLLDHRTRLPSAAQLDAGECAYIAATLHQYLSLEQQAQRDPSLRFPALIAEVLTVLDGIAARHRASVSGHSNKAPTSAMADTGHAAAGLDHLDGMLDAMDVAALFNISARQARRRCAEIGTKVGGRWLVRRADLEEVTSE